MTPFADCSAGRSGLRRFYWLGAVALFALASACAPKIGDKCTVSTDCSSTGARLCDSTEPGGYCTVFNCEPNACPDDSLCVAFTDPTCTASAQSVRFERTFCMATCQSDGDCRAGYKCLDVSVDEERRVLDVSPASHQICAVAGPAPLVSPAGSGPVPAVCNAFDGSLPEAAPITPSDAGDSGDGALPGDSGDSALPGDGSDAATAD